MSRRRLALQIGRETEGVLPLPRPAVFHRGVIIQCVPRDIDKVSRRGRGREVAHGLDGAFDAVEEVHVIGLVLARGPREGDPAPHGSEAAAHGALGVGDGNYGGRGV